MGTTLTGTQIQNTYDGLIKTGDNTAITATTKLISDGLGNDTCIKVGTAGTDFLGAVDFSAATVTGLPGGAAGLVSGTGTDSMKNADSLVTTPAAATGACSIALGEGSTANAEGNVAIGVSSNAGSAFTFGSVAIGQLSGATGLGAIGMGYLSSASGSKSIALGYSARANINNGIALGEDACANADHSYAIGTNALAGNGSIAIGRNSSVTGNNVVAIGCNARSSFGFGAVSIGQNSTADNTGFTASVAVGRNTTADADGIAIGCGSRAQLAGSAAIGKGVTSAYADTVSIKALETQTASTPTAGGIIMNDAGSVARRLNIDASGNLQIDSTPVGGGGAAGLESGTGTDSMQSAASLTTVAANASGNCSIALGDGASSGSFGVAIGKSATNTGAGTAIGNNANTSGLGVSIGDGSSANGNSAISIGYANCADGVQSISIGVSACAKGDEDVVIGLEATSNTLNKGGTALGSTTVVDDGAVAIGRNAQATGIHSISIGGQCNLFSTAGTRATATSAIAMGISSSALSANSVAIGSSACVAATANRSIAIGCGTIITAGDGAFAAGCEANIFSSGIGAVAIGKDAKASANAAIGIGWSACATACGAVALGFNLIASRACTTASCQFEALEVGKGVVVTSPDGLTTLGIGIDNTGAIVTYTP